MVVAVVVVVCVLAGASGGAVSALQWNNPRVVTGDGGLFYPGVRVMIDCGPAMDIRLNNTMTDGTVLQLAVTPVGGGQSKSVSPPTPAGTVGPYCDGCFTPNTGYQITVRNGIPIVYFGPTTGRTCSHLTITAFGTAQNMSFTATPWLSGQYFSATFYSPYEYMPWTAVTDFYIGSPTSVVVDVPQDSTTFGGYLEDVPIYVNVSESLYRDGSRPLQMIAPFVQNVSNAFLQTNAFYFNARVTSNAGLFSAGSVLTIDTVGLLDSDNSFFLCAFENLMTGFETESAHSAYNFAVRCVVPPSLIAASSPGDLIALKNVTVLTGGDGGPQTIFPFYPPGGQLSYIWTYPLPPGPDDGGNGGGLSGGQIFGIIFAILVVGGVVGGGVWYYRKHYLASTSGHHEIPEEDGPKQIQQDSSSAQPVSSTGGYGAL